MVGELPGAGVIIFSASKKAQAVRVYDGHGTTVAAAWIGAGTATVRAWVAESGRVLPGRGHPSRAELARQPPRPDCDCPMCVAVLERQRVARHRATVAVREAVRAAEAGGSEPDDVPWQDRGACRGVGPGVFFSVEPWEQQLARELCSVCPVQPTCLEYALARNIDNGIWGGMSERARRRLKRERRR